MIRLSGCIEMLFAELEDFNARIPAAAAAGLDAVEFWNYSNKDLAGLARACQETGLPVAAMCVEFPDGMLDHALAEGYAEATHQAIATAQVVGCNTLITITGNECDGMNRQRAHAGIVACLRAAAPIAEAAGITICLEPLNVLVDHPGYFLTTSQEGFEIIEQVNSPAVKLLFDVYHQQVTEGNLIANITAHAGLIGHFHSADVPGRFAPGTGEINFANVLGAINDMGYEGFFGLEYKPQGPTAPTLQPILAIRDRLNS